MFLVTEALEKTPLNVANRIGVKFQRKNPYMFYLLSSPNDSMATASKRKDCATQPANCRIHINKMKIKTNMLEYEKTVLEQYVSTYTNQFPDTFLFTFHQIQYHSYQIGDLFYQIQVLMTPFQTDLNSHSDKKRHAWVKF